MPPENEPTTEPETEPAAIEAPVTETAPASPEPGTDGGTGDETLDFDLSVTLPEEYDRYPEPVRAKILSTAEALVAEKAKQFQSGFTKATQKTAAERRGLGEKADNWDRLMADPSNGLAQFLVDNPDIARIYHERAGLHTPGQPAPDTAPQVDPVQALMADAEAQLQAEFGAEEGSALAKVLGNLAGKILDLSGAQSQQALAPLEAEKARIAAERQQVQVRTLMESVDQSHGWDKGTTAKLNLQARRPEDLLELAAIGAQYRDGRLGVTDAQRKAVIEEHQKALEKAAKESPPAASAARGGSAPTTPADFRPGPGVNAYAAAKARLAAGG